MTVMVCLTGDNTGPHRERKFARHAALKALDYALMKSPRNCSRLVQLKGLKIIFPLFMKLVRILPSPLLPCLSHTQP